MFELYFPKSPRDWDSILCFLLDQKVSSLLLLNLSLELSQMERKIMKSWKKIICFHKHSDLSLILLTSVASVRSVLASWDMMWDWDLLIIGLWLLCSKQHPGVTCDADVGHATAWHPWLFSCRPRSQNTHNVSLSSEFNSHPDLTLMMSHVTSWIKELALCTDTALVSALSARYWGQTEIGVFFGVETSSLTTNLSTSVVARIGIEKNKGLLN